MSLSNILNNYFRVLEVISPISFKIESKLDVERKQKTSNLVVVSSSLTAKFMSINARELSNS